MTNAKMDEHHAIDPEVRGALLATGAFRLQVKSKEPSEICRSEAQPRLADTVSRQQLHHTLRTVFRAISAVLRDECETTEVRVKRADSMLKSCSLELESDESTASPLQHSIRGGLAPWQIRRVKSYVESNLNKTIRIQELADIARLSCFHFCRAFRASVHQSPHGYVMQRRVARASVLMLTTRASLCDIAVDCGLADQAHFNRLFRKAVGESPGAWRRQRAALVS
jgi:AraC family transcriptional regulator